MSGTRQDGGQLLRWRGVGLDFHSNAAIVLTVGVLRLWRDDGNGVRAVGIVPAHVLSPAVSLLVVLLLLGRVGVVMLRWAGEGWRRAVGRAVPLLVVPILLGRVGVVVLRRVGEGRHRAVGRAVPLPVVPILLGRVGAVVLRRAGEGRHRAVGGQSEPRVVRCGLACQVVSPIPM